MWPPRETWSFLGRIFTKVVLEAPLITESALEVIRKYCEDEVRACALQTGAGWREGPGSWFGRGSRTSSHSSLSAPRLQSRAYLGMSTLGDLIFKRPSRQFQYLHVLLDLSSHEKDRVSLCL